MNFKTILFGAIAVGLLFIIYLCLTTSFYPDLANRGLFGDSFGALNALFSGFAFLGIIYTIILQSQELGLQRKELELTRAELKRAAEAQEASGEALTKQAASLKITAKLNGLNSRLQYYNTLIELNRTEKYGIGNGPLHQQYMHEVDSIIQEIKSLTEDK
ncbi:hypothetical protein KKD95_01140 [Patescibacteria group bacterium]|nr:hypothetical protein [Patescibacteria group bacterium]